jgi:Sulfotransferase domain
LCLHRFTGLDLRVIHLVRDSRAVAYSWTRTVRRPETAVTSYMPTYGPAKAAWLWNAENGATEVLARTGTPTLRVRYEDLTTAPEVTLARIAEFCGLPSRPGNLPSFCSDGAGHWTDLGVSHAIGGNPMRFGTGRVAIRPDDQWRTAMVASQRQTVTALTLPLLAHYRYLGRRPAA